MSRLRSPDEILAGLDPLTFHTNLIRPSNEAPERRFGHFSLTELLGALHRNGELRGVLLTTYCLNLAWLKETCPFLFASPASGAALPVYLLHDCRTPIRQWRCGASGLSVYTSTAAPAPADDGAPDSQGSNFADSQEGAAGGAGGATSTRGWTVRDVPDAVQVEHLPPTGSDGKVTRGVQHAKLALLLCARRLVVVISTGNLVRQRAIDLSWVQAFPLDMGPQVQQQQKQQQQPFGAELERFLEELQKTGNWRGGGDRIQRFLTEVVGGLLPRDDVKPPEWLRCFDFSPAKVDLVATVPGEFKRNQQGKDDCYRFGAERVAALLRAAPVARCEPTQHDPLVLQPTSIGVDITEGYMAYLQRCYAPSAGVRRGLGAGATSTTADHVAAENGGGVPIQLVWPSQSFIDRCCAQDTAAWQRTAAARTAAAQADLGSGLEMVEVGDQVAQQEQQAKVEGLGQGLGLRGGGLVAQTQLVSGGLFLSIDQLVGMGPDVFSRLHHFDLLPTPSAAAYQPHVKMYFRAMTSGRSRGDPVQLQYALLTSACLSRGAQGFWKDEEGKPCDAGAGGECFVMRNFELGVMLRQTTKVELWAPSRDTEGTEWSGGRVDQRRGDSGCGGDGSGSSSSSSSSSTAAIEDWIDVVRLPIPFAVPGQSYPDRKNATGIPETPFCHDRSKEHWYRHLDHMPSAAAQRSPVKTLVIEHAEAAAHLPLQAVATNSGRKPAAPPPKKRKLKWVPGLKDAMRHAGVWRDATAAAAAAAAAAASTSAPELVTPAAAFPAPVPAIVDSDSTLTLTHRKKENESEVTE